METEEPRYHDPDDPQYDSISWEEEIAMAESLMNEDAAQIYLQRQKGKRGMISEDE